MEKEKKNRFLCHRERNSVSFAAVRRPLTQTLKTHSEKFQNRRSVHSSNRLAVVKVLAIERATLEFFDRCFFFCFGAESNNECKRLCNRLQWVSLLLWLWGLLAPTLQRARERRQRRGNEVTALCFWFWFVCLTLHILVSFESSLRARIENSIETRQSSWFRDQTLDTKTHARIRKSWASRKKPEISFFRYIYMNVW